MEKLFMMLKKNLLLRIMVVILIIIPILFIGDFYTHFAAHFSGSLLPNVIKQQWHIVILNIVLFVSFLIPLSFRRKVNWKEYGLVTAFFVSLFIEMYGIPLTIFFTSKYVSGGGESVPNSIINFNFLGVEIAMSHAMLYGAVLMTIGMILIVIAWITLYRNINPDDEDETIVSNGIYSYSRHPQYFGFILIVIGWFVGWPTILTIIFTPILIFIYVRVCRIEEKELMHIEEYQEYKKEVPFFV
jgi:isoprenylcysteine carboxyl methyltransferase (ICMT) family protein YpbQ